MTNINWKKICVPLYTAVLALALAQLSPAPAQAADYNVGTIHITQPWARATPKGASSGAAYLTIANNGKALDRVSCVSSDLSAHCQMHTMTMENGVMKMRPVEGGLEIKPGETVTLKPGGLHVMLVDLKQPLVPGKMAEATLQLRRPEPSRSNFRSPPSEPLHRALPQAAAR